MSSFKHSNCLYMLGCGMCYGDSQDICYFFDHLRYKIDPLSERIVVVKNTCLVMMLMMTLATVLTSWFDIVWANKHLENTSVALTMFSKTPDGGSPRTRSICMASSSSVFCSLGFCQGGWMNLSWIRDSLMHCSHDLTRFVIVCAMFG